jgi:hypothetical protein
MIRHGHGFNNVSGKLATPSNTLCASLYRRDNLQGFRSLWLRCVVVGREQIVSRISCLGFLTGRLMPSVLYSQPIVRIVPILVPAVLAVETTVRLGIAFGRAPVFLARSNRFSGFLTRIVSS